MRTNGEENSRKIKVLRMFTIFVTFGRPENHGAICIPNSNRTDQTCYGNTNQTKRISNLNKSVANFYNYCFSLAIREHFLRAFGKKKIEAFKGLVLHRHKELTELVCSLVKIVHGSRSKSLTINFVSIIRLIRDILACPHNFLSLLLIPSFREDEDDEEDKPVRLISALSLVNAL
jgi:hypothetical protein